MFILLSVLGGALLGGMVGGLVGGLIGAGVAALLSIDGEQIQKLADWCERNNHPTLRKVLVQFNKVRGVIRKMIRVRTSTMHENETVTVITQTHTFEELSPEMQARLNREDNFSIDITDDLDDDLVAGMSY